MAHSESDKGNRDLTRFPDMNQDTAKHLFNKGAILLFLDFPEGSEFGIDYNSWAVGPKFRGLKMIPPGIHFVYFSIFGKQGGQAPRIGFFHQFRAKEMLVKKWDKKIEDIIDNLQISEEEMDRYRSNLEELDRYLGPYPFQSYRTWFSLTNHVTPRLLESLVPMSGRISAQCNLVTLESETLGEGSNRVDREHPNRIRFVDEQGLPIMRVQPGSEIRFHKIPDLRPTGNNSGRDLTRNSMDASSRLTQLTLEAGYTSDLELLGEMQFAFVCFLMGQIYESFEQWKRLVHLMCSCTEALKERETLYLNFVMALHFQLKECPRDFFVDIVSKNNFLTITLTNFFTNLETTEGVSEKLKEKGKKFKAYLTKTFKWDFESEQDSPTVVE